MDTLIAAYHQFLVELLAVEPSPFDDGLRNKLPTTGGIYRIFKRGWGWQDTIYVGAARHLRKQIYVYDYAGSCSESTLKRRLIGDALFSDEKAVQMFLEAKCYVQFKEVLDDDERDCLKQFSTAVLKPHSRDRRMIAKLASEEKQSTNP